MGWLNLIDLVRANPPIQKEKPAKHRAIPRLHYVDSRTRAFDLHTQQRPLLSNVDSGKLLFTGAVGAHVTGWVWGRNAFPEAARSLC